MILNAEEQKAVTEAKKLKAYKIRNNDNEQNFSDIYFHVQHECDMFEEGEATELTTSSYNCGKKWLCKYEKFYIV